MTMLEAFLSVEKDGELTLDRLSLGTLEEKYLDQLSDYLIKRCGYAQSDEGKFSIRIIDESQDDTGETVFHDWTRRIEIEHADELGSIRPDCFDKVELPIDDPWGNIKNTSHRKAANGFWVANDFIGWTK